FTIEPLLYSPVHKLIKVEEQIERGKSCFEGRSNIITPTARNPIPLLGKSSSKQQRWVPPSSLQRNVAFEHKEAVFRKTRSILNKLTPEKFDKLCQDILNIGITSKDILKGIVILIFEKAIDELRYSSLYANLCRRLYHEAPNFDVSQTINNQNQLKPNTFRRLLIAKLQDEFENRNRKLEAFDCKEGALSSEEEEQRSRAKHHMLGNIKFIGELYRLNLLHETIVHKCIKQLIRTKKKGTVDDVAEDLECLCQIMNTCGRRLDHDKAKSLMDQYFDRLETVKKKKGDLPSRIRFMLQDVIELRAANWTPRQMQRITAPKTLGQIRSEVGIMFEQNNHYSHHNPSMREHGKGEFEQNAAGLGFFPPSKKQQYTTTDGFSGPLSPPLPTTLGSEPTSPGHGFDFFSPPPQVKASFHKLQLQNGAVPDPTLTHMNGGHPMPYMGYPMMHNGYPPNIQEYTNHVQTNGPRNHAPITNGKLQKYHFYKKSKGPVHDFGPKYLNHQQQQQPKQATRNLQQQATSNKEVAHLSEIYNNKNLSKEGTQTRSLTLSTRYSPSYKIQLLQQITRGPQTGKIKFVTHPNNEDHTNHEQNSTKQSEKSKNLYRNVVAGPHGNKVPTKIVKSSAPIKKRPAVSSAADAFQPSFQHVIDNAMNQVSLKPQKKANITNQEKQKSKKNILSEEALMDVVKRSTSNVNGGTTRALAVIKDAAIPNKQVATLCGLFYENYLHNNEDVREFVCKILSHMVDTKLLSTDLIEEGLQMFFEKLSKLETSVPRSKSITASLLARLILSDLATLHGIAELLHSGYHFPLFLLTLQQLVKLNDKDWLLAMYKQSKVDMLNLMPEVSQNKSSMFEILQGKQLAFLYPLLHMETKLNEQLNTDPAPQVVYRWIRENVSSELYSHPEFIHVLTSSCLHHVTKQSSLKAGVDRGQNVPKTIQEEEKNLLKKIKPILQKFVHDDTNLQLHALHTVQAFCHDKDFPKGLLLRMFNLLYNEDVIDEEVFISWKEDVNSNFPGKGKALFQVNSWLTWLQEADTEDDDDE
uniref:W2 domain-containing protein n=1 Tax=Ciona intestinalis TaxID=7719 RepID=F6R3K6_CIOIN